jgi:hypothetical protein
MLTTFEVFKKYFIVLIPFTKSYIFNKSESLKRYSDFLFVILDF